MINIESEVFSTVATALRDEITGIFVSGGEKQPIASKMPAAIGREVDNSTYQRTMDSSMQENHATIMWQWDVYSNKSTGRKAECKAIISVIDEQMWSMGFVRISSTPMDMPNVDASIYRMVARYKAIVSKEKLVYRR